MRGFLFFELSQNRECCILFFFFTHFQTVVDSAVASSNSFKGTVVIRIIFDTKKGPLGCVKKHEKSGDSANLCREFFRYFQTKKLL